MTKNDAKQIAEVLNKEPFVIPCDYIEFENGNAYVLLKSEKYK